MSESTPVRKTRLVPAEPHAGRYAVFDYLPMGKRRCRLCGARVRKDHAWTHVRLHADPWPGLWAEDRIAFLLRARRSRRNRKHGQYQYATGGEPWRSR